jgi:hypothetical protein
MRIALRRSCVATARYTVGWRGWDAADCTPGVACGLFLLAACGCVIAWTSRASCAFCRKLIAKGFEAEWNATETAYAIECMMRCSAQLERTAAVVDERQC